MTYPVTFITTEVLKHPRKGKSLGKFEYRWYVDKKLRIILYLREYFTKWDKHVGFEHGACRFEHGPVHYHAQEAI